MIQHSVHVRRAALLAILVGAAGGTHAQRPAYFLGSAGTSNAHFDCAGTSTCGDRGTGFKLIGGAWLSPGLSMESSAFSFGKSKATFPASLPGATTTVPINTQGFGLGIAMSTDMRAPTYGVARLGVAYLRTAREAPQFGITGSESAYAPHLGIAAGWNLTQHLSAEAAADLSWARFAGRAASVHMLTAGVRYRF